MKILLVYPEYPETFWSFKYALKFISRQSSFPPLGLLTIAAMLPERWEIKLVDMAISSLTDKDIKWADYVFISAMSIQKESSKIVIKRCKTVGTGIVGGGPLFTTDYDEFEDVDHLVLNEAEITLPQFIRDLEDGCPKHIYTTKQWAELEETPIPLWKLAEIKKYATMCIQFSRGCPFNCDFCDVTLLFGNSMRFKNKEQIVAELESLFSQGWREGVFIVDDNFIGSKKQLKKEILPAMIEWMEKRGYPFYFNTQVSINLADDEELMRLMARAGFDTVFVGIETPNEDSLAECNKFQNKNRDLVECVRKIQSHGMQVQGGFIVGFDSDTPFIFEKMIDFIQKSGIVTAMVGLLNAPKGTTLYKRLVEENRILKEFTGDNTDFSMNFMPKMNYESLLEGYKKILRTIYSPKNYYERVITLLKNFKPFPKKKIPIHMDHIKAFIRSIWYLGIKGKERVYFWKLIAWSLFKRPKLLPLAVTFAIYGFHFRKIFENYWSV